jgi:hypothetical protein
LFFNGARFAPKGRRFAIAKNVAWKSTNIFIIDSCQYPQDFVLLKIVPDNAW